MGGALTHGIIVLEMETPGRSPTLAPAGRGRAAEHGARRRLGEDRDRGCRHTRGEAPHGARQDGQEANHVLCSGAKVWLAGSGSVGPEAAGAGPLPPVSAAGGARKNAVSRGNTLKGNALCSCPSQQGDVAEETVVVWVARPSLLRRHRLLPRPPHGQH